MKLDKSASNMNRSINESQQQQPQQQQQTPRDKSIDTKATKEKQKQEKFQKEKEKKEEKERIEREKKEKKEREKLLKKGGGDQITTSATTTSNLNKFSSTNQIQSNQTALIPSSKSENVLNKFKTTTSQQDILKSNKKEISLAQVMPIPKGKYRCHVVYLDEAVKDFELDVNTNPFLLLIYVVKLFLNFLKISFTENSYRRGSDDISVSGFGVG